VHFLKLRIYPTFVLWASGSITEADIGLILPACMSSLRIGGGNSSCYRSVVQYAVNWKSQFFETSKKVCFGTGRRLHGDQHECSPNLYLFDQWSWYTRNRRR